MTDLETDKDTELDDEGDLEIEIKDDTPDEDKDRPVAKLDSQDDDDDKGADEDEVKQYSQRVRKRIDELTAERHAERRAKEALARELDEASKYTKSILEERNRLAELLNRGESFWKTSNESRLQALLTQAQREYKEAYDTGDGEALAKASGKITELQIELANTKAWNPQPVPKAEPPAQREPPPQIDKKTQDWWERNKWFGNDPAMTYFTLGVHENLTREGVEVNSDDYYRKLDAEIRQRFPDKFPNAGGQRRTVGVNVVAPAQRGSAKGPRRVTLTESQINLCKRLGITPEQYAKEMVKLGQQ